MKSSQDWSEMLAGYVLGDLTSEEVIQVQRYLAEHPTASAELADLQTTLALLPLGLPDVAVPNHLKSEILTAATGNLPAAQPRPSRPRRNWSRIAGGIAAAVIAALGVQNYQLHQQMNGAKEEIANLRRSDRDQMAILAANNGRTLSMQGNNTVKGAVGKVFIVPQQNRALLAIDNLPQPPAGKVYHLWAMVNGQKVSCIQFAPEQDGKVMVQIPANRWLQAVEVSVTLEAEQSNAMPAGEMVMQGQEI